MNLQKLMIYSEENPTPRQFDALQTMLNEYRQERGFAFTPEGHTSLSRPLPEYSYLVLGSAGPDVQGEHIYTYSLKQLTSRPNAKTVLFAALDNYFGRVQGLPVGAFVLLSDNKEETFDLALRYFDFRQPIAVDVETGGILGENVTPRTAPMLTIAFAQEGVALTVIIRKHGSTDTQIAEMLDAARQLVEQIEKPIFHNGKFDIAVIEANTGYRMPNWFDTMLAHHVLNHAAREHGLKILCKRYFNADDWEGDIKTWIKGRTKDYSNIPVRVLARYNGYDVLWTYRLWQKLALEIGADDNAQMAFFLEMQAAEFLADVEKVGIPFSALEAVELEINYRIAAKKALVTLRELTGRNEFNPGSPPQVKQALKDFGVTVSSTDEEHIDKVKAENPEDENPAVYRFCVALIEYRKANKMISTYIVPWRKASEIENDDRAHPTFNVHGTTTGRLSSSDPNAQNVPRDKTIRKMVTLHG